MYQGRAVAGLVSCGRPYSCPRPGSKILGVAMRAMRVLVAAAAGILAPATGDKTKR